MEIILAIAIGVLGGSGTSLPCLIGHQNCSVRAATSRT